MLAAPTKYGCIQFRSRTEAEWAVVLSAHQVSYDYEPIVFLFDQVVPKHWLFSRAYLPDFWLREIKLWLEIKPSPPSLIEHRKAALLAECTGCGVLISMGSPSQSDVLFFVKGLDNTVKVSTLDDGPFPTGPLRLRLDDLSEAQSVHPGLQHLTNGLCEAINTCADAYDQMTPEMFQHHEPSTLHAKHKRVTFLEPGSYPFAACYCGIGQDCWKCRGAIRAFINEESAKKLRAIKPSRPLNPKSS
jgi:hypothetical protein